MLQIPGAKAAMAVYLEWAHPEFLGQSQGVLVVDGGWLDCRSIAPRHNIAQETPGIGCMAAFLVGTGKRQFLCDEGVGVLQAAVSICASPNVRPRRPWKPRKPVVIIWAMACVSSGTASATRPSNMYAAPKAAATLGK
jgi:hypothetical protein